MSHRLSCLRGASPHRGRRSTSSIPFSPDGAAGWMRSHPSPRFGCRMLPCGPGCLRTAPDCGRATPPFGSEATGMKALDCDENLFVARETKKTQTKTKQKTQYAKRAGLSTAKRWRERALVTISVTLNCFHLCPKPGLFLDVQVNWAQYFLFLV